MRIIPIQAPVAAGFSDCNEDSGEVPRMNHLPLARREFLKGSGVLMGTLAKDLDAKAAGDAAAARMLKDGVAALNQAAGGDFGKADAARKLAIVKGMEGQPFFATVRGQCITSLYDNDRAYATFGCPGSAWEKGGYITRGFQDLKWLPEPSKAASPPADL